MNIVLIGYRGAGKSAVARFLSQTLGKKAVSLDEEIKRTSGMSIPKLVEEKGWEYFRDVEQEIVREFCTQDNLIIDCGGGAILRPANVKQLRTNSRVVWLQASVGVIASRIGDSTERPALVKGKTFIEEIAEVLSERSPLYDAAADFAIDTDKLNPEQVAHEIILKL